MFLVRCLLLAVTVVGLRAETVAILGDSLTAGYGLDESQAYPALVQRLLEPDHPGLTVVNAGVSGDTSSGALRRLPWVLKAKPRIVLVAVGANDGLRGQPVDQLAANLTRIIAGIRAGGATPLLAGMQLPTNLGPDYRTAFAAVFPQVAKDTATPLLPFLLADVAMQSDLNQADRIHPNALGQQRVAATVAAFLRPFLADPAR